MPRPRVGDWTESVPTDSTTHGFATRPPSYSPKPAGTAPRAAIAGLSAEEASGPVGAQPNNMPGCEIPRAIPKSVDTRGQQWYATFQSAVAKLLSFAKPHHHQDSLSNADRGPGTRDAVAHRQCVALVDQGVVQRILHSFNCHPVHKAADRN